MTNKEEYFEPLFEVIKLDDTNIITCSGPWEEIDHPIVW